MAETVFFSLAEGGMGLETGFAAYFSAEEGKMCYSTRGYSENSLLLQSD